jgi:3D (Asp-Asp-Asp) domain-containing protein
MKKTLMALATQIFPFFKKGAVVIAMVGLIPGVAVAEPSSGTNGSQALEAESAVAATVNFKKPKETRMVVKVTAYNSDPRQTDDSPCITASNYNVCAANTENIVAANFVPLGTKMKIPALFGDRVFSVEDRTAKKYGDRVDVWRKHYADARAQGIRQVEIVILQD